MQYKYAKEKGDYSHLSSGRVFYSLPGHPAFPVRLASEIFQRCLEHRNVIDGTSSPCVLYDPCCGAAYHLSVVAYLHGEHIREVIASDVDEKAVALAERNLRLLHAEGLDRRIEEIRKMIEEYGKESHQDAMHSAFYLRERLSVLRQDQPLKSQVFQASATEGEQILNHIASRSVDVVFTDVPYGWHSRWQGAEQSAASNPLGSMLEALLPVLSETSVVAIVSDKGQRAAHERYRRLEQFQVGKRRVTILKPSGDVHSRSACQQLMDERRWQDQ
jgi:23S rRNA (guanine2535-N1)-methyltransferase